jgi:hypothetical protein
VARPAVKLPIKAVVMAKVAKDYRVTGGVTTRTPADYPIYQGKAGSGYRVNLVDL